MSINILSASGYAGTDMELHYTGGGTCIGNFSLPVESGFGEHKKTTWVVCRVIGERAEKLAPYIKKGALVTVAGAFTMDEWESDNVKHARPCILISSIQLPPQKMTKNTKHTEQQEKTNTTNNG